MSQETAQELVRVLTYPKFRLSEAEQEELLGEFLPFAEVVRITGPMNLPKCRDESAQMFIELAAAGKADALITGDNDLLDMSDELPFDVITPAELRERQ